MRKRKVFELRLKAKHLLISLKGTNEIHIGDKVIYNGEEFFVNNGVYYPSWDIVPYEWNEDGKRISQRIHQKKLRKPFWVNFKRSALFHYKFYLDNWYDIDLRDLINGKKASSDKIMGW